MLKKILAIIVLLSLPAIKAASAQILENASASKEKWITYYSNTINTSDLLPYNPLVLDSDYYPNLLLLKERNKVLLGYISLGEVENDRDWFGDAKKAGILLLENENWKGSFYVDLRNEAWADIVLNQVIPEILRKGFTGIFIDTMDNPIELEENLDPVKYKGMKQAAANLIKAISYQYPQMPIMLNRGFEILPEVAPYITMVLGESTYSGYDFEKGKPHQVTEKQRERYVRILSEAKRDFPHLKVMTLDYWDPEDKEKVREIYKAQREQGFIPYVSTVELDRIIEEPEDEN